MANKHDLALRLILAAFEMGKMAAQILLFHKAYQGTAKKEGDTNLALFFIIFNPISLIGGFTNLQSFADALWYLLILAPLTVVGTGPIVLVLMAQVVAYFNPGVVMCLIPLFVLITRLQVP